MTRTKHGRSGDLEEFEAFNDGDSDLDMFVDVPAHGPGGRAPPRSAKAKAAWQRVDERKDIELLKAQLEDWEDWDADWSDDYLEAPRAQ